MQAVPGDDVDVNDRREGRESGVPRARCSGRTRCPRASHQVDFSGGDGIEQATTVEVAAGSNQDVVLHLPASVGGDAW